jgi:hypothetical protein
MAKIVSSKSRRAETIEVAPILTDLALLESVLSPEQCEIVEEIGAEIAEKQWGDDHFYARMAELVKKLWPKGCDWDTWKAVRGVIFENFGEYGARCLRNGYDAAGIGDRPTASGNANGNANKGKLSGAKWVSGAEKRATDWLDWVAKMPKSQLEPAHVKRIVELAKSLMMEVKATKKDLAA